MKFRHAATLALVVWYLMIPIDKGGRFLKSVTDWSKQGPFDSDEDCETKLHDLTKLFSDVIQGYDGNGAIPMYKAMLSAQCITSDDPRLKSS
jgi:hypothetical protein